MSEKPMTAYCVKCRDRREISRPVAVYTANGAPATSGVCPVCGTRLFKMGRTPAHEGVPRPQSAPKARARPAVASGGRPLVIVESPAKARTVGHFLGSEYAVKASVGHIRDLPRSQLGVDPARDFAPKYLIPKEKRAVVKELRAAADAADLVYLASDPDREGEAISWHLTQALGLDASRYRRVTFHEITAEAVRDAFAHPRDIDMALVDAQQARRVLDRLVGYEISPILWKKVRGRLSAGRVQSVALRLIVEREREIAAFVPVEYWTITAELARRTPAHETFRARLLRIDGQEPQIKNEAEAHAIVDALQGADYVVQAVEKGVRRRNPSAPFTTSTLQQDANRRLGFTAKRTMAAAQALYEGVDVGEGRVGLITYMRTDSTNVAASAQAEARQYIQETFGGDYLPAQPPQYKTRTRKAQEAHEAIRPTSVLRTPDQMKPHLKEDEARLYDLIWRRFVASQMTPAVYDTTTVDILAGPATPAGALAHVARVPEERIEPLIAAWRYQFRANGAQLRFPGYLAVYGVDPSGEEEGEGEEGALPELARGEVLDLRQLLPEQHWTQPPPRYTEATLVRALEERGIGRPSTYAPILTTLLTREYVARHGRQLYPTELGMTVNDLLVAHFPTILDYDFTAHMEEDLDLIADGDKTWVQVLREFYAPFADAVAQAKATMPKVELAEEETGLSCPQCGGKVIVKRGRFGRFFACSNYPACRYTAPYVARTGARCPECGGDLVERRSKKGRVFYGCANYPTCAFVTWNRPLPEPCPSCGGLVTDAGKKGRQCIKCGAMVPQRDAVAAEAEGTVEE